MAKDDPGLIVSKHYPDALSDPSSLAYNRCRTGAILVLNYTTRCIKVVPLSCHRWSCPTCSHKKAGIWAARAAAAHPERFFTFTGHPRPGELPAQVFQRMRKGWPDLVRSIRKKIGTFEYVAIWELTKKGFPHLHILQRGDFLPKKWLDYQLPKFGFGPISWLKKIHNGPQAAHYVTKYLAKGFDRSGYLDIFDRRIWASQKYFDVVPDPPKENPDDVVKCYRVHASVDRILKHLIKSNAWRVYIHESNRAYIVWPTPETTTSASIDAIKNDIVNL